MKKRITYEIHGQIERNSYFRVGKALVRIEFTGGAINSTGVYPAQYTTDNPLFQRAIENSEAFRSGEIKRGRVETYGSDAPQDAAEVTADADNTVVLSEVTNMQQKYHNSYYWENLIRNRKVTETFNNEQITKKSVFFQGIIYNSAGRRKLIEDVMHFTSLDALAGYLHYVFLPTAFMSFTNQEKGIIVPLGISLPELIDYVSGNDFVRFHNYLQPMYQLLELSEQMSRAEHSEQEQILKRIESIFNYSFQMDRDAYAMMHVYHSTTELGEYFSNLYQIDGNKQLGIELFRHKTGLHKTEWEQLYRHASDNIFSSLVFVEIIEFFFVPACLQNISVCHRQYKLICIHSCIFGIFCYDCVN